MSKTPLMEACIYCETEKAKDLIEGGADLHVKCKDGLTALMYVSGNGAEEIVKLLIDQGVDVNVKSNPYEDTALLYAASNGYKNIVELLLKANANPNIQNIDGESPMSQAEYNGHTEVVDLLSYY